MLCTLNPNDTQEYLLWVDVGKCEYQLSLENEFPIIMLFCFASGSLFVPNCTHFCFQNTLGKLKDLVELKDQLEDIQKRVEDEIQAGLPPVRLHRHKLICTC